MNDRIITQEDFEKIANMKRVDELLAESNIENLEVFIVEFNELKENQRTVQDVINTEIVERLKIELKRRSIMYLNEEHRKQNPFCDTCNEYELLKSILENKS